MSSSKDLPAIVESAVHGSKSSPSTPSVVPVRRPLPGTRRFRARRVGVEELNKAKITVRGWHSTLGSFEARAEDLSVYGLALILPPVVALVGDRIDHLEVRAGETPLFSGTAIVRHVVERAAEIVVGVELQGPGLDLAEIYRRGERYGFAERLQTATQSMRFELVSPEFKAWVAEVHNYLETIKDFLDQEEAALANLDQLTRNQNLAEYLQVAAPVVIEHMNQGAAALGRLVADLPPELHVEHRAFLRKHLMPFICESPLLRRSYEKPAGYAGDYEIMNMLYRDHAEGPTLFAKVLNLYAAQEGAAQANINRIEFLGKIIRGAVESSPRERVRIASIGCGPAREILALLEERPELGERIEIALIDQEEQAIKYCERTLGPLATRTGARVQYIRESVRRLLLERQLGKVLGQRDLIYSAGLFDYLNGRTFSALLAALYDALAPSGRLLVGNVAAHNPSRWFMEYTLDWFLIHRSREELLECGNRLTPRPEQVEVTSEPLGINLFLSVQR